jgi:hypothetical protein
MDEYAVEDIRVDPSDMNLAFRRGLRGSGVNYLEELQKMAANDYELEGEDESISHCFDLLKKYILSGRRHVGEFELRDLQTFGLSPDVVNRIGYLAFQHDSISPLSSFVKKQPKSDSKASMDEYDDDFEVEDELDVQMRSAHLGSSDELYIGTSPPKGAAYSSKRYESKSSGIARTGSNAEDDIEEETYDVHRNARPKVGTASGSSVNTPQKQPTGRLHPRISPEVNYAQQQATRAADAHHSSLVSPPKPAVVASAAFLPTQQRPAPTGLSKSSVTSSPSASVSTSDAAAGPTSADRASTASSAGTKPRTGRVSRSSHNGRIKTASWIETRSWRLGEKIGSGAFGEVFQGLNDKVSYECRSVEGWL